MKMLLSLVLLSLCVFSQALQFNNDVRPEVVIYSNSNSLNSDTRIRGMRNTNGTDFVLGGLFSVHSNVGGRSCGEIRPQGGLDRVEAMLFAIDLINSNSTLLPNITIGYDIRDTCFIEQIGLDEAADLILTGTQTGLETQCTVEEFATQNANTSNQTSSNPSPVTIGIIGAGSSQVTIPIAGLSRLFSVPQISYSSTSAILSDRERYTYFYRTVPSDNMEVRAMIDLLQYYGWTFISTIFSENSYGQSGINDLQELAAKYNICIDLYEGIEETFNETDYQRLARKLTQSTANVVVFFATEQHVKGLFNELEPSRHFTWIASSAWTQIASSLPSEQVVGLFGLFPLFSHVSHFQDYYSMLSLDNNARNPWFQEFYSTVLNCTLMETCDNLTLSRMEQEYSIPLVIDAVYVLAYVLHEYLTDSCESPLVWNKDTQMCNGQTTPLNGSILLQYIANVNFTSPTGNTITFNREGSVQALYEIVNFQPNVSDGMPYSLQRIGTWNSAAASVSNLSVGLNVNTNVEAQFGIDKEGSPIKEVIRSECGACLPGQYLREVEASCCGLCENCLGELYSNTSRASECSNCSLLGEKWGDKSTVGSTGCVEIPKVFLRFSDPFSIVIMIASIVGIILVLVTAICLGVFWTSPVIKASSRESVILILIGVLVSFASSFFYLSPPSLGICSLQRILIWFGSSLMYGALVIKVIRIARIFVFQKSGLGKMKFMNTYHQVIFSLLLVAGQMAIVLISLLVVNPSIQRDLRLNNDKPNALPEVIVTCQPEPILGLVVSVLYEAALILISAVLSTLSFKSPANFNEAKAICSAAYILLAVWTMFFVSYIFTQSVQQLQNAFIALTNILGAYAVLGCFFGPKLFVVLFWKEKNAKQYSRRTTEGDVWQNESVSTVFYGKTGTTTDTVDFDIPITMSLDDKPKEKDSPEEKANGEIGKRCV